MDDKLPPPIKITQGGSGNSGNDQKDDDTLFKAEVKLKNPLFRFFDWIKSYLKRNQNITIKIPIIGTLIAISSYSLGVGSGYNWGFNSAISKFFPNSSPLLHRAITLEGTIQKSDSQKYYLKSEDNLWTLKAVKPNVNLASYVNKQVQVLGNLTKEANLVEVSEIIPFDLSTAPVSLPPLSLSSPSNPSPPSNSSSGIELPELYPALSWQTTQKRVLIFTSGKRKIEQEGVYLESAQVTDFPQDFINYYINGFKDIGFKETLNSISPDGITITYAKDDLFLTFGTKNVYSGSGDKKQLTGYKAFIEHN